MMIKVEIIRKLKSFEVLITDDCQQAMRLRYTVKDYPAAVSVVNLLSKNIDEKYFRVVEKHDNLIIYEPIFGVEQLCDTKP